MARWDEIGIASYREYLASPRWQKLRAEYWASDLPKTCWVCGAPGRDLHHPNYGALGEERIEDLVLLCRLCHENAHEMVRSEGCSLRDAHRELRRRLEQGKRAAAAMRAEDERRAENASPTPSD